MSTDRHDSLCTTRGRNASNQCALTLSYTVRARSPHPRPRVQEDCCYVRKLRRGAMSDDDVSIGEERVFSWRAYSVSARDKEPLLKFIRAALKARGCTILHI